LFQLCFSEQTLEGGVLLLELLEALGVVGLEPAVLVAPPVVRLFRHAQLAAHRRDVRAIGQHPVGLSELAHDLLRRVPLPRVRHDETSLPARSSEHQDDSHNDWTYITGSAQVCLTPRPRRRRSSTSKTTATRCASTSAWSTTVVRRIGAST